MLINLSKWGNSLGVRIPASISTELGLSAGSTIKVVAQHGHIVLKPHQYKLNTLLAKVTPKNLHAELSTNPVGKEIW